MISAIISWPDGFDFPMFRQSIPELSKYVHETIVCFNKHGNVSQRDWLKNNVQGVKFLDVEDDVELKGDWRSKSTNHMINNSTGDWLLSLEQDFFITDYPHFFKVIHKAIKSNDVIMFPDTVRFHPAFMLFKKEVINKTHKDFSTMGQGRDHFCQISKEMKGIHKIKITSLQELDLLPGRDWEHMRGLTDNEFSPKPYFDLPSFSVYNEWCYRLYKNNVIPYSDYRIKEMERMRDCDSTGFEKSTIYKMLCHTNPKIADCVKKSLILLAEDKNTV